MLGVGKKYFLFNKWYWIKREIIFIRIKVRLLDLEGVIDK